MCGIIGYIGEKQAQPILLTGLRRLEYRGYDSAGCAIFLDNKKEISVRKLPGKVKDLEQLLKRKPLEGSLGIGHCLVPDTLILLSDGRFIPISKIKDEDSVFSFNLNTQKLEPARVRVTNHKSPRYLYSLRTPFVSLTCSAQHRMFVSSGGKITEKKATDIKKGDTLLVPKNIEIKGQKIQFRSIYIKRYYNIAPEANQLIKDRLEDLQLTQVACASSAGITRSYMNHVFNNDRNFREDELCKLLDYLSIGFDPDGFIPQNTIHGKFINLPNRSSPELMQILGYLLGDGTVKERCIRFKDLDREVLFIYHDLIKKVFNIDGRVVPVNDTKALLLEANSFYLCQWLKENIISRKEEFLSELGQLPQDETSAFLRGIFDAEGCVGLKNGQICLANTNEMMTKVTQLLLLRFNIISHLYRKKRDVKNWSDYHILYISNNLSFKNFAQKIGFSSRQKQERLNMLIEKKSKRAVYDGLKNPAVLPYPILEIDKIRSRDCLLYDLEVEHPSSNFIANGFVSHNSRWATHGEPNQVNAHPHSDCKRQIAVVHNGIIENYAQLKQELIKEGHKFASQTDTEVIVHLIEKFSKNGNLEEAVRKALSKLEGSFAIGVISSQEPDKLIGARLGSPLIVGVGENENFLASDAPAILDATKNIIFLGENEIAILTKNSCRITDFNGKEIKKSITKINWDITQAQKQGYKHFMLKEINEQPKIIENLISARIQNKTGKIIFEEQAIPEEQLKNIRNIAIVACGTAYHAGLVGKYILESICGIQTAVDVSSEFRYRDLLIDKHTLVIAISQSGETADTLAGVRQAKKHGAAVLSICNVLGSTLTRESDGVIYTHAGPEIGVASTKAYTAQLAALYLFAFYLAGIKNILPQEKIKKYLDELQKIPKQQEEILQHQDKIANLAHRHSHFGSFLYLGRNINFPSALEGALKLKEISYIPAEGYAAGEMKHGPIALIDEYRAVVCVACDSKVYEKMVSNLQEIRARKGRIIVIASRGDEKIKAQAKEIIYIPKCSELFSPLLVALPLQLIAYHIAVKRGCDVDQPRNLAKSVTVE